MIFDIYGKQVGGKLVVELPYHEFNWTDKIALRRVIIDWKTREKTFAVIKSNLVDLGPANPKQQLLAFSKPAATTITDIDIPDPEFYRVQIQQSFLLLPWFTIWAWSVRDKPCDFVTFNRLHHDSDF